MSSPPPPNLMKLVPAHSAPVHLKSEIPTAAPSASDPSADVYF